MLSRRLTRCAGAAQPTVHADRKLTRPEGAELRARKELVETVRDNVTIDWARRENVRAQRRVLVERIVAQARRAGELEQAAALSAEWAAG